MPGLRSFWDDLTAEQRAVVEEALLPVSPPTVGLVELAFGDDEYADLVTTTYRAAGADPPEPFVTLTWTFTADREDRA